MSLRMMPPATLFHLLVVMACGAPSVACAMGAAAQPPLAGDSVRSLQPGGHSTLAIPLGNPTSASVAMRIAVEVPAGWRVDGATDPVVVPAHGRDLKFLTISVGHSATPGSRMLRYAVIANGTTTRRDSVWFVVAERRALSITPSAPRYSPFGSTYLARFVVRNAGNSERAYQISVVANMKASLEGPAARRLRPGSSDTVRVEVRVPRQGAHQASLVTIRLKPAVTDSAEQLAAFVETAVFPTGGGDPWVRLPLTLTTLLARGEGAFAVAGGGPLPAPGARIDLALRGPRRLAAIDGPSDDYRLLFNSSRWRVRLGDQSVILTPLTENGRVATGASAAFRGSLLSGSVGSVATRQVGELSHMRMQLATLAARLPADMQLQGTGLVRTGTSQQGTVGSVQLAWTPDRRQRAEVEWGAGLAGGTAWRGRIAKSSRRVELQADALAAATSYPGYSRGTRSIAGAGRWQITPAVSLRASAQDRSTMAGLLFGSDGANPDTLVAHEPLRAHRFRSGSLALGVSRSVQLTGRWVRRDDPLGALPWGAERTIGLTWAVGPRVVRVVPGIEIGQTVAAGRTEPAPLRRASLDLRLTFGSWATLTQSVGAETGRSVYDTTFLRAWHAGLQGEARSAHTRLTIGGQYGLLAVASPWALPAQSRRVDLALTQDLLLERSITARARWDPQARRLTGSDLRVEISYRMPMRIPTGHPRTTGWVRGMVRDEETGGGTGGVIVRLGDQLAMSDERGRFQFAAVPAGTHSLDVDLNTIGEDRLVRDSSLRQVTAVNGRRTDVTMAVVRAGRITGMVAWYDEGPRGSLDSAALADPSPVRRGPAAGLTILLRNGVRTVLASTDGEGRFAADGLEPGRWNINIAAADLPSTHELSASPADVEVVAAHSVTVAVRLLPRRRRVHVLDADAPGEAVPRSRSRPRGGTGGRTTRPAPCPWPVVRPNGPICAEAAPADSILPPGGTR